MAVSETTARWTLIDGTMADVQRSLDRALLADHLDVSALFRQIESQLDALLVRLVTSGLPKKVSDDALVPLSFWVDEMVLERLAASHYRLQADWPLLRKFAQNERFGGDAFYARADALCASPLSEDEAFVADVYLYCIRRGFVGCYAGRGEEIERYRQRLWRARGAPSVSVLAQSRAPFSAGFVAPFWIILLIACIVVGGSVAVADRARIDESTTNVADSRDASVDAAATQ